MPYLVSTFPTLSSESLEIQLPWCCQNSTFFSRYTHRAKGRGKLWDRAWHGFFLHYLQSGGREKVSVFRTAFTTVLCAFLILILDSSNLFWDSELWGPAGAEQRPHKPLEMWESHAVLRELYQLHIGFQMKLSWCVINSGFLRNWPYLCSSAGVLLLIIPAFIFQDMKEQWPKLLFPTCFNPNILQHSFRTFCMKSTTLPTLV